MTSQEHITTLLAAVQDGNRAALDEALKELERLNERQSRVVECRFFAGLQVQETPEALGISPATVKRDGCLASAWLRR